jgi:hypothetical protein
VTTTAISAVVPRRRTTLTGRILMVSAFSRPWTRLDVELSDGTGTIVLRFTGRREIPGLVPGRQLDVDGTPSLERDRLIMRNPLYSFANCRCQGN